MMRRTLGLVLVAAGTTIAFADVTGTPFEQLGDEVDQRTFEITPDTPRNQKRALAFAARQLRKVDGRRLHDIQIAKRLSKRLGRAFPDDGELAASLATALSGLADTIGNDLIDLRERVPLGLILPDRFDQLLNRADGSLEAASGEASLVRRARHLRRASKARAAAKRILDATLAPPPRVDVEDDPDRPNTTTTGNTTIRVNGQSIRTTAVEGAFRPTPFGPAQAFSLDADTSIQPLYGLSMTWGTRSLMVLRTYDFGDTATGSLRRGNQVFDQNVTGSVQLTSVNSNVPARTVAMKGIFTISAADAAGNRISASGDFDITSMPYIPFELGGGE